MRKVIIYSLLLLFCFGCNKKYPDDPQKMRFIGVAKRLGGTWHISKILIDGKDSTSLIYTDSLKIFSNYIFNHLKGETGEVSVSTYNNKNAFNLPSSGSLHYVLGDKKNPNGIGVFINENFNWDTLIINKTIITHGSINDFQGYLWWEIKKLTLEDMHWHNIDNSHIYDLYFNK